MQDLLLWRKLSLSPLLTFAPQGEKVQLRNLFAYCFHTKVAASAVIFLPCLASVSSIFGPNGGECAARAGLLLYTCICSVSIKAKCEVTRQEVSD